jgi:hypothetical protein
MSDRYEAILTERISGSFRAAIVKVTVREDGQVDRTVVGYRDFSEPDKGVRNTEDSARMWLNEIIQRLRRGLIKETTTIDV